MKQNINPISLLCRDMRHGWNPVGDTVLLEKRGQIRTFSRTLECFRCSTVREDIYEITASGVARVRTAYRYPHGYHVKGGLPVSTVRYLLFKNATMKVRKNDER